MNNSQQDWGICEKCKWWQIEPEAEIGDTTMGVCIDEELQPFVLRVSANSGCNRFQVGKPHRKLGASKAPPKKSIVQSAE